MKKLLAFVALSVVIVFGFSAFSDEAVTKDDIRALVERLNVLEKANKAQAEKIKALEEALGKKNPSAIAMEEGTSTNDTGRIWTTAQGYKYYLADKAAGIFEPLSESGLKITPYAYIAAEAIHVTKGTEIDYITDIVRPKGSYGRGHTSCFTLQDSILGLQFETPEAIDGWKFTGRAEFDLLGSHANDYGFHWRHLYIDAVHEESRWSILFGQTWHLWKMVTPGEIDGAWLEHTGHPYRRSPQIRVTKEFDFETSKLTARAGIVKNGPGMGHDRDGDGNQDNSASGWPLIEGALIYEHDAAWEDEASGKRWLIGVGGMYGREKSHNEVSWIGGVATHWDDNDEYESKMLMVATKIPVRDFTITAQLFAGDNLNDIQAGAWQGIAFYGDGHGREVSTIGGFVDLNWKINAKWSTTIGYGFDDPTDSEARHVYGIAYNDRAYANVFYRVMDNFRVGFEYSHLRTKYDGVYGTGAWSGARDGTASSDRFEFIALYDF
jgi:hypothetical protein